MLSDDRPGIYRKTCKDTLGDRTKTRERSDWQSPADWSSSESAQGYGMAVTRSHGSEE